MAVTLGKRHKLYFAQAGECCYCGTVMLMTGDMRIGRFMQIYGLTKKQASNRRASIEHLKRRTDGGTHALHNVALACTLCNSKRQSTPWNIYAQRRSGVVRLAFAALMKEAA